MSLLITLEVLTAFAVVVTYFAARHDRDAKPTHEHAGMLWRAFQRTWVAAAAGGFFVAVIMTAGGHAHDVGWPVDWLATVDAVARFLYVVWFAAYFFVNNIDASELHQAPTWRSIWFDVFQVVISFVAVWHLGYMTAGPFPSPRDSFVVANGVVVLICATSLYWFKGNPAAGESDYQRVRWDGLLLAVMGLVLAFLLGGEPSDLEVFLIAICVLLFGALREYLQMSLKETACLKSREEAEKAKAGACTPCPDAKDTRLNLPGANASSP